LAEACYSPEGASGLSRIYNLRGSIEKRSGQPDLAESSFLKSIHLAQSLGEPYSQGLAQMNLAILHQELGRIGEAQQAYQQAFGLLQEKEAPLLACKLRENWVLFLLQAGRNAECEKACYDLLKTAIRHRYVEQQAAALNYLAVLAGQQNHPEKKIQYLNQALGFLPDRQYPQVYFQCLLNRAYGYFELGKFVPAQLDAEQALQIGQNRGNELFIAWAQLILGKIYRDRPRADLEAARVQLNKAHRWTWSNRYLRLLWEVEYDRGLLAQKMQESSRAKNYLLSAQTHLTTLANSMPQAYQSSFLRDRKLENIQEALKSLENDGERTL